MGLTMEQATFQEEIEAMDIVVSGRRFKTATSMTFEQDIYTLKVLEESGLQDLARQYDPIHTDISKLSTKVIVTAFGSGKLFELLGAVLEEEGVPWSIKTAEENAHFFSQLRDPQDKSALKSSMVAVILGFFVSGLLSSKTSKMSSLVNLEMQPAGSEPVAE